jgi:hypothetical protein
MTEHFVKNSDNGEIESRWHSDPTWSEIETCIRCLDNDCCSSLSLYRDSEACDGAVADFEINGGDGTCQMHGNIGEKYYHYCDEK